MTRMVRKFHEGMGDAVARRTYLRTKLTDEEIAGIGDTLVVGKNEDHWREWYVAAVNSRVPVQVVDATTSVASIRPPETRWETWDEVADRVAEGSYSVLPSQFDDMSDSQQKMSDMIAKGLLLTSGRHLSHGDHTQAGREQTVFTNCSTAATSFALFYLLLNGSGVGRDYSDDMMKVDWAEYMPQLIPVIDAMHPDYDYKVHLTPREAEHMYGRENPNIIWYEVQDSREGWAHALEVIETTTFLNGRGENDVKIIVLDFSEVRAAGEPIMGMQGKPSSGPAPLIHAMSQLNMIRNSGMKPWKATMYVDHIMASVVLVGGLRRAARISTKYWKDPDILEYAQVKRPVEFLDIPHEEIETKFGGFKPLSFLWSSNNSIAVTSEFYEGLTNPDSWAAQLADMLTKCAYYDGNGEPGIVNVDRLTHPEHDTLDEDFLKEGRYFGSAKYQPSTQAIDLMKEIYNGFIRMPYHYIVNPCGEEVISIMGGFCTISDVAPVFADDLDEALEAVGEAARAMIRVNTMHSVYENEVRRTNRIGVGLTGVFEFAWKFFKADFHDLIEPDFKGFLENGGGASDDIIKKFAQHESSKIRAAAMWEWIGKASRHAHDVSVKYSSLLDMNEPHTVTTIKPSGCRPADAITTTDKGILTLQELMADHGDGEWSAVNREVNVYQGRKSNRVTKTFDNGVKEVFAIEMEHGLVVESTGNHPWYVNGEWKETANIEQGDTIEINLEAYRNEVPVKLKSPMVHCVDSTTQDEMTNEIAFVMGLIAGSGGKLMSDRLIVTSEYPFEITHIQRFFLDGFGVDSIVTESDVGSTLVMSDPTVVAWLHENQFFANYGGNIVPRIIRESSRENIFAFIHGMVAGMQEDSIDITFRTEEEAMQFQNIAWAVGLAYPRNGATITLDQMHDNIGRVVSVRSIGDMPTFDIEVENDHWFYAGAVKSHNTVSKIFGLTEGWHLPPIRHYIRWVQFRDNNPMLQEYKDGGYPVRKLTTYKDHHIVGFPTAHAITEMEGITGHVVTADEASLEEQFKWLKLGEFFWIEGGSVQEYVESGGDMDKMLDERGLRYGAQISITLKFAPDEIPYGDYKRLFLENMRAVRCASVMPKTDTSSYEYLPEEEISEEEYYRLKHVIENPMVEDVGSEHVQCDGGACPIDFKSGDEVKVA